MRSLVTVAMLLASGAFAQTKLDGVWVRGGAGGGSEPTTQWSPSALSFTPAGQKQLTAKPLKVEPVVEPMMPKDEVGPARTSLMTVKEGGA